MNPFHPDFPQPLPPGEAMNEGLSEQEGNEIHAWFPPHHRFPNSPANTPAEHLSQEHFDIDDVVSARNPVVPHTVGTWTSGAEPLIRHNRPRGRDRAAISSRRPPRRKTDDRMEHHKQSGMRAPKNHSRHCHLCNKKTSSDVPHARLCTRPGCRKAVCLRCSIEVNWPGKTLDAANFACSHCLIVCGEIANRNVQCFAYNAETERRRQEKRQRRGRLLQIQPLRTDNPGDRIAPPRPSCRPADLLRENEVVLPLNAGQCLDPAPTQNVNHRGVLLMGHVARQFDCPDLNLLPPQDTVAEVIGSATFLNSQQGIEHVTAHASTTDEDSWHPIFDA